jgi:quercetin dioxygenase-like cupin family protein
LKVIKLGDLKTKENMRGIMTKDVLKNDNVQVKNLILKPGDIIPSHQVSVDVFFHVLEGEGTIILDGEEFKLSEKDFITCPPNTPMKVKADQGVKFNVLNVKTPALN